MRASRFIVSSSHRTIIGSDEAYARMQPVVFIYNRLMAFCPALFRPPSVRSLSDASEELVWRSGYARDWWGPSGIDSVHASNGGEKKPTYFIAINWPQLQYSGQCFSIWPASSYQEAAELRKSPSQIHRMVKARVHNSSLRPSGRLPFLFPGTNSLSQLSQLPL